MSRENKFRATVDLSQAETSLESVSFDAVFDSVIPAQILELQRLCYFTNFICKVISFVVYLIINKMKINNKSFYNMNIML